MSRQLFVIAPPDLSPFHVGLALQDMAKALKDAPTSLDQANARHQFLRLQERFRQRLHDIFEQAEDDLYLPRAAESRAFVRSRKDLDQAIATFYEAAFQRGLVAGGADRALRRNELAILAKQRANERAFGANFLTDIRHGEGKMPYSHRADLYANAMEELYWQGYLYADLSADRYTRWVMPAGVGFEDPEHCMDCARLSGNVAALPDAHREAVEAVGPVGGRWGVGIYSALELARLGVTPQSGKLLCTTHCHCRLEPAKRPSRKPVNPRETNWRSVRPKDFTGTQSREGGKLDVTRLARHGRRRRLAREAERTEHRHLGRSGR